MTVLRDVAERVVAADSGPLGGGFLTATAWAELLEEASGVSRLMLGAVLTRRTPDRLPTGATGADVAAILAGYRDDVLAAAGQSGFTDAGATAARFDAAVAELRTAGPLAQAPPTPAMAPAVIAPLVPPAVVTDDAERRVQLTRLATAMTAVLAKPSNVAAAGRITLPPSQTSWQPYGPRPSPPPEYPPREWRPPQHARSTRRSPAKMILAALPGVVLIVVGFSSFHSTLMSVLGVIWVIVALTRAGRSSH